MQFWQSAWKLSILLPPFLPNSWRWQNGVAEEKGGALIFPPLTFTVLLLIKNSAVYLYLSWNTQIHPTMYCILKICWFICKDCARWNRKILLKTPSYQSRAYLACLNSVVPFSLCPRWLWKAHHVSVSSQFNTRTAFFLCPHCFVLSVLS